MGVRRAVQKAAQVLLLAGVLLVGVGCRPGSVEGPSQTLTVYAAASLKGAVDEIVRQFEARYPGTEVLVNFAGSQQLAQQIVLGAPVDVFASANDQQMAVVIESGRIDPAAPQIFVHNRLIVILPPANPGGLVQLADLANPGLRVVMADEKVPVGRYAADFLDAAAADPAYGEAFAAGVRQNVVSYEENVRAVTSKVALGEADAGLVYRSDYESAPSGTLNAVPIPAHLNPWASYPIAPLADATNPELAGVFIDFVLSPDGQAILGSFGYLPIREG